MGLAQSGCDATGQPAEDTSTEVVVSTGSVIRTTLAAHVLAFGTVLPSPAGNGHAGGAAYLTAPGTGIVYDVPVSEGQQVHAGELIVRLDDRMAQAELDRAKAHVAFAEKALDRQRTLLESEDTSRLQVDEAEQALAIARADLEGARGALAQVQLRSPLDGVVSRLNVLPGQAVDSNAIVAEIVDPTRLMVSANVPATDAKRIQTGQTARVTEQGDGDGVEATVSFVSPAVDPASGPVLVRLTIPEGSTLRPGRFVHVAITVEEHAACLAVPIESVYVDTDGQGILHVVDGDLAMQKTVQVGLEDDGWIEVEAADLQEGMKVVTTGSYGLPEQTRIREQTAVHP